MILSFIFHIFKTIFGYAIRFIAWLLVSLSLWVPLLYTVVFLMAVGLSNSSLTNLRNWYLFGLILSFIGSFAISSFLYEKNVKRKKNARSGAVLGGLMQGEETASFVKKEEFSAVAPLPVPPANIGTEAIKTDNTTKSTENQPDSLVGQQINQQNNQSKNQPSDNYNQDYDNYKQKLQNGNNDYSGHPYYQAGRKEQSSFDSAVSQNDTAQKHGFYPYDALNKTDYYGGQRPAFSSYAQDNLQDFSSYENEKSRQDFSSFSGEKSRQDFSSFNANQDGSKSGYKDSGFNPNFHQDFSSQNFNSQDYNTSNYNSQNDTDSNHKQGYNKQNFTSQGYKNIQNNQNYNNFSNNQSLHSYTNETPKIFATRGDPTVFIYEYSDRLDYYKRTRSGMIFMHSKQKPSA